VPNTTQHNTVLQHSPCTESLYRVTVHSSCAEHLYKVPAHSTSQYYTVGRKAAKAKSPVGRKAAKANGTQYCEWLHPLHSPPCCCCCVLCVVCCCLCVVVDELCLWCAVMCVVGCVLPFFCWLLLLLSLPLSHRHHTTSLLVPQLRRYGVVVRAVALAVDQHLTAPDLHSNRIREDLSASWFLLGHLWGNSVCDLGPLVCELWNSFCALGPLVCELRNSVCELGPWFVNCGIQFVNWAPWFVNCGIQFVNWPLGM
jgi:hypothetical protein